MSVTQMSNSNARRVRRCVVLLCMIIVLLLFSHLVLVRDLTGKRKNTLSIVEKTKNKPAVVEKTKNKSSIVEKTKNKPAIGVPLRSKPIIGLGNVKVPVKRQENWMRGTLKPHSKAVVPNIAHFIWFTCHEFRFDHLIPVLSAYHVMKADRILFHTDCEPDSQWWNEAKAIPVLEVIKRQRRTHIFARKLNPALPEHASDVARLEILREYGGVYLDMDVVVINSLEPLRHYEFVIGQPAVRMFNNGMLVAAKNSTFLKLFYDSYKMYDGKCFTCNSGKRSLELARRYPRSLHVEHSSVQEYNQMKLFFGKFNWWEHRYTMHVWIRDYFNKWSNETFTADNIRQLNTSYGEIARYVYYGTKDILNGSRTLSRLEENAKESKFNVNGTIK